MKITDLSVPTVVESAMFIDVGLTVDTIIIGGVGLPEAVGLEQNYELKFRLREKSTLPVYST